MATIRKRGAKYQVQVRRLGAGSVSKSFHTLKDAEAWARQAEVMADRRELASDPKALQRVTLGELVVRYRDTVTPRKRGQFFETAVLNAFLRHHVCSKRLSDITPADFASYRDERLRAIKPATLRRQLNPIRNLFEIAREEWGVPIRENPLAKLRLDKHDQRRERRLRPGELEALTSGARALKNPLVLAVIEYALATGMRRGEILGVRWEHLDRTTSSLVIPHTKNGHSRTIPLTRHAWGILDGLPRTSGLVFPISANAFRLGWERLTRRCGIEDLHFHDLRHEAISRFFEKGLSVPEVALISGHRDARMLFRYTHPMREKIIGKLDAHPEPY